MAERLSRHLPMLRRVATLLRTRALCRVLLRPQARGDTAGAALCAAEAGVSAGGGGEMRKHEEKAMKHTPGPWKANGQRVQGPVGVSVAHCSDGFVMSVKGGGYAIAADEAVANARLIAAAPTLLEACKKALFDSSLDRSETVLSAEVHEALNNAVASAEDCDPIKESKRRVPSPALGPRSWCFGQGPAETENGYWDDACDNCECIDRCAAISKAEKGA